MYIKRFISVTGSLPTTSYVKMVDLWMLFNLFLPFVQVVLHTYIDFLRDGEEEEREINHHGKSLKVGGEGGKDENMKTVTVHPINKSDMKIFSTNEKTQQKAIRDYYQKYIMHILTI